MKNKTALCTDHSGLGGPVRYWTDVPREEQAKRVARTLARRLFGRVACFTEPRLLSVNPATRESLYGCAITDKHAFEEQPLTFYLPARA